MKLYHFTSSEQWPDIRDAGILRVTESNVSMDRVHAGPDVVWLTDDPTPIAQAWGRPAEVTMTIGDFFAVYTDVRVRPGEEAEAIEALRITGSVPNEVIDEWKATGQARLVSIDKTAVRITVDVPDADALRYSTWRRSQGINDAPYRALAQSGGDPERWWVVERPIPSSEWMEVVETATGSQLDAIP